VAPDLEAQVDEPPELFADLVARAVGAAGVLDVEESTEVDHECARWISAGSQQTL
jgi:hypothetical protein